MSERARLIAFSAFLLANLTLVGFVMVKALGPRNHIQYVTRLEEVLPVLAKYKVRVFQNFSGCHSLAYVRGQFTSKKTETASCRRYNVYQPLDAQAESDFAAINAALSASGVGVDSIDASIGTKGDVIYAEFHVTCMLCGNDRDAYSPNVGYLPDEVPNNLWHLQINQVWYLIQESWH